MTITVDQLMVLVPGLAVAALIFFIWKHGKAVPITAASIIAYAIFVFLFRGEATETVSIVDLAEVEWWVLFVLFGFGCFLWDRQGEGVKWNLAGSLVVLTLSLGLMLHFGGAFRSGTMIVLTTFVAVDVARDIRALNPPAAH